jgi:hypothetical protein
MSCNGKQIPILDARFLTNYEPTANWMKNLSTQTGLPDDYRLREFMQQNAQGLVDSEREAIRSKTIPTGAYVGQCSQGWSNLSRR